jgi:hypothetical protein
MVEYLEFDVTKLFPWMVHYSEQRVVVQFFIFVCDFDFRLIVEYVICWLFVSAGRITFVSGSPACSAVRMICTIFSLVRVVF